MFHRAGHPGEHGIRISNRVSIYSTTRIITISGFGTVILIFTLMPLLFDVGRCAIVSAPLENMAFAFGIAFLSIIRQKLLLLPVWRLPY